MALSQFTAGATLPASDLNEIVDHLQGASGSTDAWHFRSSTGNNFLITLSDNAGARKFSVRDSDGTEVFSVNSDGALTAASTVFTNLDIPTSASPSQTTEGRAVWDSDDDRLTIGTGAATKVIGLSRGAGSDASATQELMYDTTAAALKVWNGSASVAASVSPAIPEILSPFMFWDASVGSSTVTANTAYLIAIPPLTRAVTVTKLRLYIATSSNNLDVGIYSYDGTDLTRVVSLGSTASPGTGSRDFDIADTALSVGTRYYFAYAPDNATISVRTTQPAGTSPTIDGMMLSKATSFPLPATIAAPTKTSPISPIIYGLVSGGAAT